MSFNLRLWFTCIVVCQELLIVSFSFFWTWSIFFFFICRQNNKAIQGFWRLNCLKDSFQVFLVFYLTTWITIKILYMFPLLALMFGNFDDWLILLKIENRDPVIEETVWVWQFWILNNFGVLKWCQAKMMLLIN